MAPAHIGESGVLLQPPGQLAREPDVFANVVSESLSAVEAQHEHELECAEPSSQGHVPVAVIDDFP